MKLVAVASTAIIAAARGIRKQSQHGCCDLRGANNNVAPDSRGASPKAVAASAIRRESTETFLNL
jgi:hypothetical protein